MKDLFLANRKPILLVFSVLMIGFGYFATQLKFSFSFEQFFPQGDDDLAFFEDFIKDFETDDNFLLIAIENQDGVFDSSFLQDFHSFSLDCRGLPHVVKSQSLTQLKYPLKTPFGLTTIPVIHLDEPNKFDQDKRMILDDERFKDVFLNSDASSAIVSIKNIENIGLEESQELVSALKQLLMAYNFDDHHILGRAYFSNELVEAQLWEIILSTLVSGILLIIVMFWIYRKPMTVLVSLVSITMAMTIFMGLLGLLGRELNVMSALYPVLMLIVGTSDVIHIMTKYIDELKKGLPQKDAIWITIKEIGLATLLTSLTTAIGFMTLLSSRIVPIRDFGLNAAIGVIIAYIVVVLFTTAWLSLLPKERFLREGSTLGFWDNLMNKSYQLTLSRKKVLLLSGLLITILCAWGTTMITTNYKITSNLPKKGKVTEDFLYFEKNYGGFRPMEFAVQTKGDWKADDYEVQLEIEKLENNLRERGVFHSIVSVNMMQKSLERMNGGNRSLNYKFPDSKTRFKKNQRLINKLPDMGNSILMSPDKQKARMSSRVLDIGADNITALGKEVDQWVLNNLDATKVSVRRTGTGILVDKNAKYVRESLVQGLGLALIIISILMGFLFKNTRMLVISLIPNLFPLLFAAALLGFLGIELEAGIAIVFAIIFGIAVDDTIHFLSKFKLAKDKHQDVEKAIYITFLETGKAICLTTVVLFFGFLIMLFSNNPASVNVGLLISITLISAVICDLFLLPILIRRFIKY